MKAGQSKIKDIDDLKEMMQFNAFENKKVRSWREDNTFDPEDKDQPSFESPTDALGSRSDLKDDVSGLFGEIDVKITNLKMGKKHESWAISGPSHLDHPPFKWSDHKKLSEAHRGLPDVWDFEWGVIDPTSILNADAEEEKSVR